LYVVRVDYPSVNILACIPLFDGKPCFMLKKVFSNPNINENMDLIELLKFEHGIFRIRFYFLEKVDNSLQELETIT